MGKFLFSLLSSCKVGVVVDTPMEDFTAGLLPGEERALPPPTALLLHQSLLATGTENNCQAGQKFVLFN